MKRAEQIFLALVFVLVGIQVFRPARNQGGQVVPADFVKTYNAPDNVAALLRGACYDCHSDNTNYPWYFEVQPVGWLIARDVEAGKAKLSFSDFGSMSKRKQGSRLREIEMQLTDGSMPLTQYKLLHKSARLSQDEVRMLIKWIEQTRDGLALER